MNPAEISAIIDRAAALFWIHPQQILANTKTTRIVLARSLAVYAIRERFGMSYPEIGRLVGKCHSAAIYACRRIGESLDQPVMMAMRGNILAERPLTVREALELIIEDEPLEVQT